MKLQEKKMLGNEGNSELTCVREKESVEKLS